MKYTFYNSITDECKYIRNEVFVKEQCFIDEFDDIDDIAHHLIVYIDNLPVATGRVFRQSQTNTYGVGRIAVLKQYRSKHIGSFIMETLEKKAKELGAEILSLSSQSQVKDFYLKHGYTPIGDTYYDQHCEHIKMIKHII